MSYIQSHKNSLIYALTILGSILFLIIGYAVYKPDIEKQGYSKAYSATVLSVDKITTEDSTIWGEEQMISNTTITFTAKLTNSEKKGAKIQGVQYLDGILAVNPKKVEAKDRILVSLLESGTDASQSWNFVEYNRSSTLLFLCGSFFFLLLLFGRSKGFHTILSLVLTCCAIFMVFVPSILKGYNIYGTSILISIYIILMSLLLINGANKKTLCAIIGNLGGLLVSGLLALFINHMLKLTGVVDNDSAFLLLQNTKYPIDLKAIVWSGMVIGSLGAVMDVAMSIASAMQELSENMRRRRFKKLLRSGLNIGRDAMGTMTNTLILAYIGSSLAMVLLLVQNNKDLFWLFNLEMIVVEITQGLVGSIGILCAIPITSAFAAWIYTRKDKKPSHKQPIGQEL